MLIFKIWVKLSVFHEQTLYLITLKENESEIYMQMPGRDFHLK